MADRLRQIAQRLKDKVHLPQLTTTGREKVDQMLTKYAPAKRVSDIAERFKHEAISKRVRELVNRYEKFTGVEEIMAIQNTVIEAQVSLLRDLKLLSRLLYVVCVRRCR